MKMITSDDLKATIDDDFITAKELRNIIQNNYKKEKEELITLHMNEIKNSIHKEINKINKINRSTYVENYFTEDEIINISNRLLIDVMSTIKSRLSDLGYNVSLRTENRSIIFETYFVPSINSPERRQKTKKEEFKNVPYLIIDWDDPDDKQDKEK